MSKAELEDGAAYEIDTTLLADHITNEEVDQLRRLRQKELAAAVAALGITKKRPSAQEIRTSIELNKADLTPEKIDQLARLFGESIRAAFTTGEADSGAAEDAGADLDEGAPVDAAPDELAEAGQADLPDTPDHIPALSVPESAPAGVSREGVLALKSLLSTSGGEVEALDDPAALVAEAAKLLWEDSAGSERLRHTLNPQIPTAVIEQAIAILQKGGGEDDAGVAAEWLRDLLSDRGAETPAAADAPEPTAPVAPAVPAEDSSLEDAPAQPGNGEEEPAPTAPEQQPVFSEADLPAVGDPVTVYINRGGLRQVEGEFVFQSYNPDTEEIVAVHQDDPSNVVRQKTGHFLRNNPLYQAEIREPFSGRAPRVGESVSLKKRSRDGAEEGEEWTVTTYHMYWDNSLKRWTNIRLRLAREGRKDLVVIPAVLAGKMVGETSESATDPASTGRDVSAAGPEAGATEGESDGSADPDGDIPSYLLGDDPETPADPASAGVALAGGGEPPVEPPLTTEAAEDQPDGELRRQLQEIITNHSREIGNLSTEAQQWIQQAAEGDLSAEKQAELAKTALVLHGLRKQLVPFLDWDPDSTDSAADNLDLAIEALVDMNHRLAGQFDYMMGDIVTTLAGGAESLETLLNDEAEAQKRQKLQHVNWQIDQLCVEDHLTVERQAELRDLLEACGLIPAGGELIPHANLYDALWSKRVEIIADGALLALLDKVAEGVAAERNEGAARDRRRQRQAEPEITRLTKEEFDQRAPEYFKQGLRGLFGGDDALLGQYLDADPNTPAGQQQRRQILGELAEAALSDEEQEALDIALEDETILTEARERLEEYGRVIDSLIEDAVHKFEHRALADRLIAVSRIGQGIWTRYRQMGLTRFAGAGNFFARFTKRFGLGVLSGILLRTGTNLAGRAVKGEAAAQAVAAGASTLTGAGAISAVATMVSMTNLALSRIEGKWMQPPRHARPKLGMIDRIKKAFGAGAAAEHDPMPWIEELEPEEALQRVLEARLYLTRQAQSGAARSPAENDVRVREMDMYRRLLQRAVGQIGQTALAAAIAEADAAVSSAESDESASAPAPGVPEAEPVAVDSIPAELTQGLTVTLQSLAPDGSVRRSGYTGEISNPPIAVGQVIRMGIRNFQVPVTEIVQQGEVYTIKLENGASYQLDLAAARSRSSETAEESSEESSSVSPSLTAEELKGRMKRVTSGRQLGRALIWGAAGAGTSIFVGHYVARLAGEHFFGKHHETPDGQAQPTAAPTDHPTTGNQPVDTPESTPNGAPDSAGGAPAPRELPNVRGAGGAETAAPTTEGGAAEHPGGAPAPAETPAPAGPTEPAAAAPPAPAETDGAGAAPEAATPGEVAPAEAGEMWVVTEDHFQVPEGGHEMMTHEDPSITAGDISREAKEWLGGTEQPVAETQYAEHLVRADLAEKLGLWQDHQDGTGEMVWNKDHIWTKQWDPTSQKFYLRLDSPVQMPGMANVPAGTITVRDGAFDFGDLKPSMVSPTMVEQFNSAWPPFAEIRADQIYNSINTDLDTLAHYTGVPVETLQANPGLTEHLQETARQLIRGQVGVTEGGKPVDLPKIEGWTQVRPAHSLQVKSDRFLTTPLHQEAENWSEQNGVQLLPPRPPANPLQNWSGRGTGTGGGTGGTSSNGYAGWGSGRSNAGEAEVGQVARPGVPAGMGSQTEFPNGANGAPGVSNGMRVPIEKASPTHLMRPAPLPGEEGVVEVVSSEGPAVVDLDERAAADSSTTVGGGGNEFSTTSSGHGAVETDGATSSGDQSSGGQTTGGIRSHSERLGLANDEAVERAQTPQTTTGNRVEINEPQPSGAATTNYAPGEAAPAGSTPTGEVRGNRVEIREQVRREPSGDRATSSRVETLRRYAEQARREHGETVTREGDTVTNRTEGTIIPEEPASE